ncbi:MAG: DUF5119 domain-containing protein [Bacteroidales bacterium]|nr:DUF5119 domain-containing protein [Bacteroidales bacterium]
MNNRFFRILFSVLLVALMAVSCQLRDLEDPSQVTAIDIKVNVQAVTNVNANVRSSVHLTAQNTTLWDEKLAQLDPSVMRVLVYSPETDRLLTEKIIYANGVDEYGNRTFKGDIGISHGDYNFLIYNFDTPTTQVMNLDWESQVLAYTDKISYAQKARLLGLTKGDEADDEIEKYYENISIHYEPEHLLVANEKNVHISPHDTLVTIETEASTIVDSYYLQIRVVGMQYASEATAVITGLSPSNKIGLNERTIDPSAAVVFDLKKGVDDSLDGENKDVLCAVFNTFGKIENVSSELRVTFNVVDTAGNLLQHEVNLDAVFESELAKKYHWLIIEEEEPWVIPNPHVDPQPGTGGGGFQPVVDDWEEQTGEITL